MVPSNSGTNWSLTTEPAVPLDKKTHAQKEMLSEFMEKKIS